MAWIEQGTCNQRPGETLVGIEKEGFGMVCAVLDYEGESVYHILRALNAFDDLLAACKGLLDCCELNLDETEPETLLRIIEARVAIAKAEGE